jgi:hypothetical protein
MIRRAFWPSPLVPLLAAAFAVAVFAPASAWAAGAPDDDQGKVSHLMAMADFNRDGIADIAEADLSGVLTVSLGQADGTFKRVVSGPVLGHEPRAVVAGDFNRDGNADLIVGDDDGSLKLFLGDGTGNLAAVGDVARLESVVSIAVADFNHDGVLDMAVSDWRGSSVTVLLGMGNGSFQRGWSFPLRMAGTVAQVAAADFNGDGIVDLAVTYDGEDGYTFEVMLGNGNGTFTFAPKLSFIKDPNSHCAT